MGKRNKKRPSSNLLVGQEYYVITFAQICSSHRWSSRYIAADDSFRDAIWSCCRFSVRYLTSEIAWVEMGMQCTSSNDYQQENDRKKVSGPMVSFSFPTCFWTHILAGWCEISLHRLPVAIPVGRWRNCSFHLCNHHVVSRLWVLLQTVLSWIPTKHCLTSN